MCQILDRLGSRDPVSAISPLELKIVGLQTAESVALQKSLRRVVDRFQELEQKARDHEPVVAARNRGIETRRVNTRPAEHQLENGTWTPPQEDPQLALTHRTDEPWYS